MQSPIMDRVLISRERIARRVEELGRQISEDYRDQDLVLIGVLKGSVPFLADLTRAIDIPHGFDFVGASSYHGTTKSSGHVSITRDVSLDLTDRHVLLIEDIYDTGRTMDTLLGLIELHQPATLQVCSFLVKNRPRPKEHTIHYTGFDIADLFVIGYGLDYEQKYRNLPEVWVMRTPEDPA